MDHVTIWFAITVATLLASYRPAVNIPPPVIRAPGPESRDVVHFDAPIHSQATLLR